MRLRVEMVQPAWEATRGGPSSLDGSRVAGSERVGRYPVLWVRTGPDVLRVTHPLPLPSFAALLFGARSEPQTYDVLLCTARSGRGERTWWRCPGCGNRTARLYLPAGRPRLGCRRCCRLLYASQYARR